MQINLLHLLLKKEGKLEGGRPLKEEACLWRSWPLRCIEEEEEGEVRRVDGDQHSSCAPRRYMLTSPLLLPPPLLGSLGCIQGGEEGGIYRALPTSINRYIQPT